MQGMILAAGFGTRMLPVTRFVPKALLPVGGRTLLEWNLEYLGSQGVSEVAVNAHHLRNEVAEFIASLPSFIASLPSFIASLPSSISSLPPSTLPRVHAVLEQEILGTAGGIANAWELLTSDPVVVMNVDMIFRPPLRDVIAMHRERGFLGTLLCAHDPLHAQIQVEGDRVREIHPRPVFGKPGLWGFTGIYLLSREAVARLRRAAVDPAREDPAREDPNGEARVSFREIVPDFRAWMAEGRLGAACFPDRPFLEAGTPEAYLDLVRVMGGFGALRDTRTDAAARIKGTPIEGAPIESGRIEAAQIGLGARIEESVILRGAVVEAGAVVTRSILGPGARVGGVVDRVLAAGGESRIICVLSHAEEEEARSFLEVARAETKDPAPIPTPGPMPGPTAPMPVPTTARFRRLQGDGSERRIIRVIEDAGTRILIMSPRPDPTALVIYPARTGPSAPNDTETYLYIQGYLRSLGVPVPEVHASDSDKGLLLLEDLGDTQFAEQTRRDLARGGNHDGREVPDRYAEAIAILLRMQETGPAPFDPERTNTVGYDAEFILRYEAGYFHREMVTGLCGEDLPFAEIETECRRAAVEALESAPMGFMHRDYQSRNLMATRRGLVVIDFQGARLGPPEYDLASLVLDPYAELAGTLRQELVDLYLSARYPAGERAAALRRFRASGINRMMQALGAFAFLGGRLGKPGFLDHVPSALGHLRELTAPDYPQLHELAGRLRDGRAWR